MGRIYDRQITIRLTEEQKEQVTIMMKAKGYNQSEWFRQYIRDEWEKFNKR